MVHFFSNWHTFKFSWESVTNVWWQKYPNPHSLQVDSVDTIDRKFDSEGTLVTRRLISAHINTPMWMVAVGFPHQAYILEESRVNPKKKEMELRSRNVTGENLLVIQETCKYKPSKENPLHTKYTQSAEITSFVPMLASRIEQWSLGVHSGNAFKGLDAMEELCDKWAHEGYEGFQRILNMRLDTILLMKDLSNLQTKIEDLRNINVDFGLAGFGKPNIKI